MDSMPFHRLYILLREYLIFPYISDLFLTHFFYPFLIYLVLTYRHMYQGEVDGFRRWLGADECSFRDLPSSEAGLWGSSIPAVEPISWPFRSLLSYVDLGCLGQLLGIIYFLLATFHSLASVTSFPLGNFFSSTQDGIQVGSTTRRSRFFHFFKGNSVSFHLNPGPLLYYLVRLLLYLWQYHSLSTCWFLSS